MTMKVREKVKKTVAHTHWRMSTHPPTSCAMSGQSVGQWFSTFFGWRHIFHTIIFGDTFLCQNTCLSDKFACSLLKMISQNNLATHWRKLVTHKCVATPCLRNTGAGIQGSEVRQLEFYLATTHIVLLSVFILCTEIKTY